MNRHLATNTMNFEAAKAYCDGLGKKLPIPSSMESLEQFKTEIFRSGRNLFQSVHMKSSYMIDCIVPFSDTTGPIWFGITDQDVEGTFKNIYTGETVHPLTPKLIPFTGHEPNDYGGNEVSPSILKNL